MSNTMQDNQPNCELNILLEDYFQQMVPIDLQPNAFNPPQYEPEEVYEQIPIPTQSGYNTQNPINYFGKTK